ncbi:thioredoxin family protein [Thiovibrio frasassiensis]|jgi:predicted DsbA family dithiol-disulfide isomerase|uniref:Thioredoxin family protein n=1 Tax=Thiovibrio frasassiensis TaxID=2984131 RepID=A0A9X4MH16_9BACT|nr:thioredoxin family protein [Thiovibrio frasassiensis]MDG4477106.1 thioredoxin family protein [Thiovibrio frasassiensis]
MRIELYRTILCPRCLLVGRSLKKIVEQHSPQIELEVIEVATHLTQTRQAGIRTVPAIKIGNDILTGLILTPQKIRCFIEQHLQDDNSATTGH